MNHSRARIHRTLPHRRRVGGIIFRKLPDEKWVWSDLSLITFQFYSTSLFLSVSVSFRTYLFLSCNRNPPSRRPHRAPFRLVGGGGLFSQSFILCVCSYGRCFFPPLSGNLLIDTGGMPRLCNPPALENSFAPVLYSNWRARFFVFQNSAPRRVAPTKFIPIDCAWRGGGRSAAGGGPASHVSSGSMME